MKDAVARPHPWRKWILRHLKAGLQNPQVFRWCMFGLRVLEEIRRWWS